VVLLTLGDLLLDDVVGVGERRAKAPEHAIRKSGVNLTVHLPE
jgi:hypothetical protein